MFGIGNLESLDGGFDRGIFTRGDTMTTQRRNVLWLWIVISVLWVGYVSAQPKSYFPYPYDPGTRVVFAFFPPFALLSTGVFCLWVWRRYCNVHWLKFPANIRSGLFRLYIVISSPWVAWFGIQLLLNGPRWRYFPRTTLTLLIVPMGAPILFIMIAWVAAGFRQIQPSMDRTKPGQKTHERPNPLTSFCIEMTEPRLRAVSGVLATSDPHRRAKLLFAVIRLATADLWNELSKVDGFRANFATTNSDVLIAEALYCCYAGFGDLLVADFDAAVAAAPKDEHGLVKASELFGADDALIAYRGVLKLIDTMIEHKTGWDVTTVRDIRLKEYWGLRTIEEYVQPFQRRMLASVDKQRITDTDALGAASHTFDLAVPVSKWLSAKPKELFRLFKSL